MKKIVAILSCLVLIALSLYTTVSAASITPQLFSGNDSNPDDYSPPAGYIHYEIPDSDTEGTHTVTFNELGAYDSNGLYSFTTVVGTEPGEKYTKVLSRSSNFPVSAIIVKGEDAFNLYEFDQASLGDTYLVSPENESGKPAAVSHVSIVFNPKNLPHKPPFPKCPPNHCQLSPPHCNCINTVLFFIIAFLLGLIFGIIIGPHSKKHNDKKKDHNGSHKEDHRDGDNYKNDIKADNPSNDNHENEFQGKNQYRRYPKNGNYYRF